MLQKIIKYFLIILFFGLLLYNAVYFKKISEMQVSKIEAVFDAKAYAKTYLLEKIPAAKKEAVEVSDLLSVLNKDSKKAFTDFSHFQNEGDMKYFFVKGEGKVTNIDEEFVTIKNTTSGTEIELAIQYIFGNTSRDCSGIISIDDFSNTMDLNNVSEEINKLIKSEIVSPFTEKVQKGDTVSFLGGIELSQSNPKTDKIEIVPLQLEINSK
jgi:predicted lipoprotein